jgi:hypothetical protein
MKNRKPGFVIALTMEEIKKVREAAQRTWNRLGGDVLQEAGELSKEEVVDFVRDAGYMEMENPADVPTLKKFRDLPYDQQTLILRDAFPFDSYGM